jgi:MerR family Zn(II)-responsive transcriptional regulator of zntA
MRIGELAEAAGTTTKALRFYEEAGLLPSPERTGAGYRNYPPEIISRLAFIRRSQSAGLTLAQIREILQIRDGGQAPCEHVQELLSDRLSTLDRQIAELQEVQPATVASSRLGHGGQPATGERAARRQCRLDGTFAPDPRARRPGPSTAARPRVQENYWSKPEHLPVASA